jgi:hypothetical protein
MGVNVLHSNSYDRLIGNKNRLVPPVDYFYSSTGIASHIGILW